MRTVCYGNLNPTQWGKSYIVLTQTKTLLILLFPIWSFLLSQEIIQLTPKKDKTPKPVLTDNQIQKITGNEAVMVPCSQPEVWTLWFTFSSSLASLGSRLTGSLPLILLLSKNYKGMNFYKYDTSHSCSKPIDDGPSSSAYNGNFRNSLKKKNSLNKKKKL